MTQNRLAVGLVRLQIALLDAAKAVLFWGDISLGPEYLDWIMPIEEQDEIEDAVFA